jgi:hypothetical protein
LAPSPALSGHPSRVVLNGSQPPQFVPSLLKRIDCNPAPPVSLADRMRLTMGVPI